MTRAAESNVPPLARQELRQLRERLEIAERIVKAIWPYALSGSVNDGSRRIRDQVVMEELIDRGLEGDVRRILNDEQWMTFDNHLVPGPRCQTCTNPGGKTDDT